MSFAVRFGRLGATAVMGAGMSWMMMQRPIQNHAEPKKLRAEDVNTPKIDYVSEEDAGLAPQRPYNPETGEINWDCPCLGGMADGPCGPEFKEAFSCFVYSQEELKGSDCIPKFQNMQNCFRRYPEVYAEQLGDDAPEEDAIGSVADAPESATEILIVEETSGAVEPTAEKAGTLSEKLAGEADLIASKTAEKAEEIGAKGVEFVGSESPSQEQIDEKLRAASELSSERAIEAREKLTELSHEAAEKVHSLTKDVTAKAGRLSSEIEEAAVSEVKKIDSRYDGAIAAQRIPLPDITDTSDEVLVPRAVVEGKK